MGTHDMYVYEHMREYTDTWDTHAQYHIYVWASRDTQGTHA